MFYHAPRLVPFISLISLNPASTSETQSPEVMVYLGLGSNLAEPLRQLNEALQKLASMEAFSEFSCSSVVKTPPLAGMDQPDYLNCVCRFKTSMPAHDLLELLRSIEDAQGRERKEHWGARTLDIDILLYGEQEVSSERLNIPHPGIEQREFVLVPLLELCPDLQTLDGRPYASVLKTYYQHHPSQLVVCSS